MMPTTSQHDELHRGLRYRLAALAMATTVALALAPAAAQAQPDFAPGAPGVGDPYFPLDGNGGYELAVRRLEAQKHPTPAPR